jgi:hypothetical protein
MDSAQLPNYLIANRKRLGLSQAEVAFLLAAGSGEKVCRHERFSREPNLATALAYEAIYKRTASELFSGLYRRVEREVAARAKSLAAKMQERGRSRRNVHKCRILAEIARIGTNVTRNQP